MSSTANTLFIAKYKIYILCILFFSQDTYLQSQNYEAQSVAYNMIIGGITACTGALINKKIEKKKGRVILKNFSIGAAGGMLIYTGKKMNTLIAHEQKLGYGWLSHTVFCAGISIVENISQGKEFWETWHYDFGFLRLEYDIRNKMVQPRIMPAAFGATLFLAYYGKFDLSTSIQSGGPTFRTKRIGYQPQQVGSTVTNGLLLNDTIENRSRAFYDIYAHEMVHSFQFAELSGMNHYFKKFTDKWEMQSSTYKKIHRWVYGDMNHQLMLINYFVVQGGVKRNYCRNFLENEAEYLTVGRSACEGIPEP